MTQYGYGTSTNSGSPTSTTLFHHLAAWPAPTTPAVARSGATLWPPARSTAERQAANACAEELLVSCLDDVQRREYRETGQFHVRSPAGRSYLIRHGYAGNVERDGSKFCIHADPGLPHADQMLGQKLMLETDEAAFLRIANETRPRLIAA